MHLCVSHQQLGVKTLPLTWVFALLGVTFSGSSCSLAGLSRTRFVVFGDVTSSFIFCEHSMILKKGC